jgi:drug/metabolite transporter (DMT)-like permease
MILNWLLVAGVVFSTVAADYLQASQMQRQVNSGLSEAAVSFFRQPRLMLSVLFMATSFGSFVTLLRSADLSFAVPASAVSFVFETAVSRWFLHERVTARRWASAILIACGVALLGV